MIMAIGGKWKEKCTGEQLWQTAWSDLISEAMCLLDDASLNYKILTLLILTL